MLLKDKNILIIGAGGGIGNAIIEHFIKNNNVFFTCSDKDKAEALYHRIKTDISYKLGYCDLNLKDHSRISIITDQAIDFLSRIDVLICNAGTNRDNLSIKMKEDEWQDVIDINLTGTFLINKNILRHMIQNKSGKIVNVSSVVAFTGNVGQANYVASKAGIVGMSKSLALESAKRNININCVAPGFIDSNMTQQMSQAAKDFIMAKIPMQKYGSPVDVVNAIEFLSGDMSNYITGTTIHVNGGMYMI